MLCLLKTYRQMLKVAVVGEIRIVWQCVDAAVNKVVLMVGVAVFVEH